jgi:hypothetical protein
MARSAPALAAALDNNTEHGVDDCADCCGSLLLSVRALSIVGMVFAIIEVIAGVTMLATFSVFSSSSYRYCPSTYLGYCNSLGTSCYASSSSSYYFYGYGDLSAWLMYAAGNTAVSSVLNLAWSVTVFRLVKLLRRSSALPGSEMGSQGERRPLISAATVADKPYVERVSDSSNYMTLGPAPTPPAFPRNGV